MVNKMVSRYYLLKNKQKQIESELQELKQHIITYLQEQDKQEIVMGSYKVRLVTSERKEYDEGLLYESLPDKTVWRLLSKPDVTKINGLLKMGVLLDKHVEDTYHVKNQLALYVDKK